MEMTMITQMTELNLPQSVIDAIEYSIDDSKNSTKLSEFMLNHDGQNESITSIGELPFSDKNLGATLWRQLYLFALLGSFTPKLFRR